MRHLTKTIPYTLWTLPTAPTSASALARGHAMHTALARFYALGADAPLHNLLSTAPLVQAALAWKAES